MGNSIQTANNQVATTGKSFHFKEESNYVLITSFNREYILNYELAQKIIQAIFSEDSDFIAFDATILNKKYIQVIEPTKEKTEKQQKEIEEKRERKEKIEKRKNELLELKRGSDAKFYNEKYGNGKWTIFKNPYSKNASQHVIDAKDMREAWVYFKTAFPSEAEEMEKIKE